VAEHLKGYIDDAGIASLLNGRQCA
jgi:hypothetical protein